MARPRKTTRRKASRKRQPKRILNVNPSPKTDEDWTFETAQDADMVAAAPSIPASKDLRSSWWKVADQGSTGSCVGWATADSVLRWHFVKNGRIAAERPALAALRLDGLEGDRPVHHAADHVHRGGGDEPQGRARHRAQVRRRARLGAPVPHRPALLGPGEHLLRGRGPAQDPRLLQPGDEPDELADLAGDEGADPHAAERGRHLVRVHRERRQPRRVPARHDAAAATPSRSSATGRGGSSSATAGARAGATAASPTPRSATRRRRSPRRTASRSDRPAAGEP